MDRVGMNVLTRNSDIETGVVAVWYCPSDMVMSVQNRLMSSIARVCLFLLVCSFIYFICMSLSPFLSLSLSLSLSFSLSLSLSIIIIISLISLSIYL